MHCPTTTKTMIAATTTNIMLAAFPALCLYPLNADSFVKHINLTSNQCVKIGRQTNAHTVSADNNGYFDLKVLSRQQGALLCCHTSLCSYSVFGCGSSSRALKAPGELYQQ